MDIVNIPSIKVCPIDFKKFDEINSIINSYEATLLYSKIKFHETHSKLHINGRTWLVRSRKQIAEWFNFSLKKVDRLLSLLESKNMLLKKSGLWYGTKKLYLSTTKDYQYVPINHKMLETLIELTGSLKSALVFSKIAFGFAKSKIEHQGLKWCCISKHNMATWIGLGIRTIDHIISQLIRKGLIYKKNFVWNEKPQTHFHIPDYAINVIHNNLVKHDTNISSKKEYKSQTTDKLVVSQQNNIDKSKNGKNQEPTPSQYQSINSSITNSNQSSQICRKQPAKLTKPIKIRSKSKKTNNNIKYQNILTSNLDKIGDELTTQQENFLKKALDNTIHKHNLSISNPQELWYEIKFAILNPQQRHNVHTFRHAVSRCMRILADENWRTPKGFHRYSNEGAYIAEQKRHIEQSWQQQKKMECQQAPYTMRQWGLSKLARHNEQNDAITQQAIRIAQHLTQIQKEQSSAYAPQQVRNIADDLSKQLMGYIRQGADKERIKAYLQSHPK